MKTKIKFAAGGLCLLLFLLLIVLVKNVDVQSYDAGAQIGFSGINLPFRDAIGCNGFFYKATQLLGWGALLIVGAFAFLGLWQWIKRKSLLRVDPEIFSLGALYIVTGAIYLLFEVVTVNRRPILMPGETGYAASFPSSHTVLAVAVLGSAALVLGRYIANKTLCRALQAALCALAALTVIGRLLSGVHWLTDILGGLLISSALLLLFAGALDLIVARKNEKCAQTGEKIRNER